MSQENLSLGFLTRSDTHLVVQPHVHKMARGMKFWIKEVEAFYHLCSESKGTDQLCGYYAAAWLLRS